MIPGIVLPRRLELDSAIKDARGETNDVFRCDGRLEGRPVTVWVKVGRGANIGLANEAEVLRALATSSIPAPALLWHEGTGRAYIVLEDLPGEPLCDWIDPRSRSYDRDSVTRRLEQCGRLLARIHSLSIDWRAQGRHRLEGLIGEEKLDDARFRELVAWLEKRRPATKTQVFVHGDYHTASVLFDEAEITGVIDWEFAGTGWREYELAWALRARLTFLNTGAEREAFLRGYTSRAQFDHTALRWCEILNYLHFALWDRETVPEYTAFALDRAEALAERG
jgi:aminoglycoside phosphotransferase (APT) family kinase protein